MAMGKIQVWITSILFSGICFSGYAQEPDKNQQEAENQNEQQQRLNREMTLERAYDPIVQDATKVNTLPPVREIDIIKRPIVYADYVMPVLPDKEMNVLPVGALMTDVPHSIRNGYLHLGAGMLMNFSGDFGYHLLNTPQDKLSFYFSHRSTNGNVRFENDSIPKRKAKLNDNLGGLDFKHHFDAATLALGGSFGYTTFNYYGLPTNRLTGAEPFTSDTATNQGDRFINVYAGISSNLPTSIGYRFGVDYKHFNQKYALSKDLKGMTENNIGLDLGLNSPINNDQRFGVDLKMNFLTYNKPEPITGISLNDTLYKMRVEGTLNPYYRLDRETWKLLLGLNVMLVWQEETNVLVSPNIALDVPFSRFSLFYAKLGGGIESNSMYEVSRYNRYINPLFSPEASRTWADLKLGVRSSATAGFWFDFFAGYKYTEADLLLNPSYYDWIENGFNNVSMAFQPVTQRIQVGATLKYDYRKMVDFYLKGVYNHYTLKYEDNWRHVFSVPGLNDSDEMKAYGKPSFTLDAGVNFRPIKPLLFNLHYSLASGVYACYLNENVQMPAINDLNLRATWEIKDAIGFYAQFNNVLFRRHELFYGYPMQPFTMMGGFVVSF